MQGGPEAASTRTLGAMAPSGSVRQWKRCPRCQHWRAIIDDCCDECLRKIEQARINAERTEARRLQRLAAKARKAEKDQKSRASQQQPRAPTTGARKAKTQPLCRACQMRQPVADMPFCEKCFRDGKLQPAAECATCGRRHWTGRRWCRRCIVERGKITDELRVLRSSSTRSLEGPTELYLIWQPRWKIVKVGISGTDTGRLARHQTHGWRVAGVIRFPDRSQARALESAVLTYWRRRGWPPVTDGGADYWTWLETVGGGSETVALRHVGSIDAAWKSVTKLRGRP